MNFTPLCTANVIKFLFSFGNKQQKTFKNYFLHLWSENEEIIQIVYETKQESPSTKKPTILDKKYENRAQ